MSRILRRPMFKMGGSTNSGIMTGLVDRKGYADDTGIKSRVVAKSARDYISEFNPLLQEFTPKTRLPLGAVGAALVSGTPMKDALISGYTDFTKRDDARTAGIQKGAVQLGLSQALKDMTPGKLLAAEREAKLMLPETATPAEIRAKAAELLEMKYTGVTYGDKANFRRAYEDNKKTVGRGYRALNLTIFEEIISPQLRKNKKIPKDRISIKDGKYITRGKAPGVYVDVENGKVVEITNELEAVVLDQYDDFFRQNYL